MNNMNTINIMFGLFTLGLALYFLYGYYMVKYKNEILEALFLPKGVDVKKCKDIKAYCREMQMPLLVLGIVALAAGAVDLCSAWVVQLQAFQPIMIALVFISLIYYSLHLKKVNKKYFGI